MQESAVHQTDPTSLPETGAAARQGIEAKTAGIASLAACTSSLAARIPSLDGLRGFSILLVIAGHVAGTAGMPAFSTAFHQLGNWGVKFFFVISGYIITRILIEEQEKSGGISIANFYVRRAARILPAYLAYLLAIVVASSMGQIALKEGDVLHTLTFTMNYHTSRSWYLNHTWSLSVEEQFYLAWPLVILLLHRLSSLKFALLIIATAPLLRALMWYGLNATETEMTRALPATADALAIGAVLALAAHGDIIEQFRNRLCTARLAPVWLTLAFVVPAATYLGSHAAFYVYGQSIMIVAIALCIDACVRHPDKALGRIVNSRFFILHGQWSYSLYLWQEPFLNPFDVTWFTTFPANLVLAYALALMSHYAIEVPARRAITQFWSSRRRYSEA